MKDQISIIESHFELLLKIVKDFEKTKCAKDDVLGLLLVLFFQRFLEHSVSVRKLKDSRDHTLIARSILEGGIIMKWIMHPTDLEERKKRAFRYFRLRNVTFKERLDAQNRKEHAQHKKTVESYLLNHKDLFDEKDYAKLQQGLPISFQSFIVRLTGKSLGKVVEEIKSLDKKVYSGNYSNMCGFHHWNPFYMMYSVSEDGQIQYGKTDEPELIQSFSTSFFILLETSYQLSIHKHLGKESEINKLGNNLTRALTNAHT